MPAPYFNRQQSLLETRADIFYSLVACRRDPHAADQAHHFEELLTAWASVFDQQLKCWDTQLEADYVVGLVDDRLDDHIDDFDRALIANHEDGRDSDLYAHYIGTRVSDLKRPVLGPELETVRGWLPSLESEDAAALHRFHKVFTRDVDDADAALDEQSKADGANARFRERGELAAFLERVMTTRDKVHATLEKRRTDKPDLKLPRDFATRVFRVRRASAESDAEKKARLDAKAAARQAASELAQKKRDAREKLREAQRALAALDKQK